MRRLARFDRRIQSLARRTHTMSLPPDTDTTIQQLIEPTIDADAVMVAAAAADAALSTVENSTASSTSGEPHASTRCPPLSNLSRLTLCLY
jgi:hypothetical protein